RVSFHGMAPLGPTEDRRRRGLPQPCAPVDSRGRRPPQGVSEVDGPLSPGVPPGCLVLALPLGFAICPREAEKRKALWLTLAYGSDGTRTRVSAVTGARGGRPRRCLRLWMPSSRTIRRCECRKWP